MASLSPSGHFFAGSLPKDLEELFLDMTLISSVGLGQKIDFTTQTYHDPGTFGWMKRKLFSSENCKKTCIKVRSITEKVILSLAEKSSSPYYSLLIKRTIEFVKGILRLMDTYKSEPPVNIESLRECVEIIETNMKSLGILDQKSTIE
jgi:hypothetical protein